MRRENVYSTVRILNMLNRKVAADLVFHAGLLLRDINYIPIDIQAGISNHIH